MPLVAGFDSMEMTIPRIGKRGSIKALQHTYNSFNGELKYRHL